MRILARFREVSAQIFRRIKEGSDWSVFRQAANMLRREHKVTTAAISALYLLPFFSKDVRQHAAIHPFQTAGCVAGVVAMITLMTWLRLARNLMEQDNRPSLQNCSPQQAPQQG